MTALARPLPASGPALTLFTTWFTPRPGMRWSRDDFLARGLLALVMLALLAFLVAPLFTILAYAVQDKEGRFVGLAHFIAYFQTPSLLRAAANSVVVAVAVALI
jgi:iron(III) transport system permease protein